MLSRNLRLNVNLANNKQYNTMIYRQAVEKVEKFVFLGSIATATLYDIKQISLASAALD